MSTQIAPSILAADFTRLGAQVTQAQSAGIGWFHIDVMDGRFVPNITMGPLVVEAMRRATDVTLDVHLMIVEPERYVAAFAQAGANIISVHYEASPNLHRTLQEIRAAGCQAGVALNPHTSADVILPVLDLIDLVNVMTVNPGFGGQVFLDTMLPKIRQLRAIADERAEPFDLQVDGGVNAETVQRVVEAGANILVAGSAIFGHDDPADGVRNLRNALSTS